MVLTERVVHLLTERGVSPSELMVLTFTRRAAGEMIARIIARLSESGWSKPEAGIAGMLIGTFHSVALRILQAHGDVLGYTKERLTVIDEDDADLLMKEVCSDLGYLRNKKWTDGLSWKKVKKFRDDHYCGRAPAKGVDHEGRIYLEYQTRLFGMNALDFGMLLIQCRRLFAASEVILRQYHQTIKHVLVDEIQDTDAVQYNLHETFSPPATFFAVGDFRQCIYNFRGARPDLALERHPDAEIIDLRDCFRCADSIIGHANQLIAHNEGNIGEPMIGKTKRQGAVPSTVGRTSSLVYRLQVVHQIGYAWSDIAVMARSHRPLKRLAEFMKDAGIPHHKVGQGFDVCSTDPFREMIAAMRLVVNKKDDLAFLRLKDQLAPHDFKAIQVMAAKEGCSLWDAMIRTSPVQAATHPFVKKIAEATADNAAQKFAEILTTITPDTLAFAAKHFNRMTIEDALRFCSLRDSQDDIPGGNRVLLLTVHAAKGLEWPCCIVLDMNEGNFPSGLALKDPRGAEEERRVAYVAFTRAREQLVLHYRRAEDQNVERGVKAPSRFLKESGITVI